MTIGGRASAISGPGTDPLTQRKEGFWFIVTAKERTMRRKSGPEKPQAATRFRRVMCLQP
jgi:hypothetical protein